MAAATGDTLLDDQLGKLTFVSKLFPEATLHLANGKEFTVKAGREKKNIKPRLNGKRIKGTAITHKDIMQGGVLEL